ncbi:serine O-acetyltransferase [Orbus sasakiae]|uniref:Serine O-acetyltransferase n=1 Tax=Orbus sasakiae TaxID=1078475 RepID=A0ABP9N326_9GAMM
MLKYFHIIKFLMTHDLTKLKEFWEADIIIDKSFKWRRLLRRLRERKREGLQNYFFWWRLANEMFLNGNISQHLTAKRIQIDLVSKYNIEIAFGARIGKNFIIGHYTGIVITETTDIGDNVTIRQNTTIGRKTVFVEHDYRNRLCIKIGNNVDIGAHTCIIGDNLSIGNNVKIGAMSFINKDIPDNCTVYTEKTNKIQIKSL